MKNRSSKGNTVYKKSEYAVYEVKDGYVVHNTLKPFQAGHTHLRSLSYCKELIDNVINKKIPDTKQRYLMTSHMRVADDGGYIQTLYDVMSLRSSRKQAYYNKNGRRAKVVY